MQVMTVQRWPELDGLRGLAILLVVVAHANLIAAAAGGMVGVTLFFVLSGFLITHLLIQERDGWGRIDLRAFYARRALRLLPALFVYLVGFTLIASVLGLGFPVWETIWPPALYVANYSQLFGMDLWAHRHTWSLAVEEHFYLIWPVLVGLGATKRPRLLGVAVGLLMLWRLVIGTIDPIWAYHATDTNAFALGIGCLVAVLYQRGRRLSLPSWSAALGVSFLVLLSLVPYRSMDDLYRIGVWMPILAALVSALLVWVSVDERRSFLSAKSLRWFGGISYALYLWHAPVLLLPGLNETRTMRAAGIAIAIGIAWCSWLVVEGPIQRSRTRRRRAHAERSPILVHES